MDRPKRSPNHLLREARLRLGSPSGSGRSLSRQELADAVNACLASSAQGRHRSEAGLDANQVGKLERGVSRWPSEARRRAFREVLGATNDAELGFYIVRGMGTGDECAQPPEDSSHALVGSNLRVHDTTDHETDVGVVNDTGWGRMLRRTVLATPAAIAATSLERLIETRHEAAPLDPDVVGGLVAASRSYRFAYHTMPASKLLPVAMAHFELIVALRPSTRSKRERVALTTTIGEMAALVGVLLAMDAARHREAMRYLDAAWSAARCVDDAEMQTVVLGCRSFALSYGGGDDVAGLRCADFARQMGAHGACPETRGWVAAVASERAASLGDLAGCQRRLDESREMLASSDFIDTRWRGVGGFTTHKLEAYRGGDMMRLRRYRDAEGLLDQALGGLPSTMSRHRATALLDRAEARLGLGDADAACDDARQALALVTRVEHIGHLGRIERLAHRGTQMGCGAAVALQHDLHVTRRDNDLLHRDAADGH